MKKIYLRDENYNWKLHEYNDISELKTVLDANKISIGDLASIGNEASIGNGASIGDLASIGNGEKLLTGFYINGSRHSITYAGNGMLCIGCHKYTIDEWLVNYSAIGQKENYTEKEIAEYLVYIQMAKIFYETTLSK